MGWSDPANPALSVPEPLSITILSSTAGGGQLGTCPGVNKLSALREDPYGWFSWSIPNESLSKEFLGEVSV